MAKNQIDKKKLQIDFIDTLLGGITETDRQIDYKLVDEMLKCIMVASPVKAIIRAVKQRKWELETDNEKMKERIEGIKNLGQVVEEIIKCMYYGYGIQEVIYNEDWTIRELSVIPRQYIRFDEFKKEFRLQGVLNYEDSLNPLKFITTTYNATPANRLGESELIPLVQTYCDYMDIDRKIRLLQQKYGAVIPVFGYDESLGHTTEGREVVKEQARAVKSIMEGSVLAIPLGQNITDIKQGFQHISLSDINMGDHIKLRGLLETRSLQYILGSSLTMETGASGSYALGEIHEKEKEKVEQQVALFVMNELKKIVEIDNILYGSQSDVDAKIIGTLPKNETKEAEAKIKKAESIDKIAIAVSNLQRIGVTPTKEWIAKETGIDIEELEDYEIPAPQSIPNFGGDFEEIKKTNPILKNRYLVRKNDKNTYDSMVAKIGKISKDLESQIKTMKGPKDFKKLNLNLGKINQDIILNNLIGGLDNDVISNSVKSLGKINPYNMKFETAVSSILEKNPVLYEEIEGILEENSKNYIYFKKVTDKAVTKKLKDSLARNIADGGTFETWKKDIKGILESTGLGKEGSYWKTVYRTNTQTAYNQGRELRQRADNVNDWWMYDAIDDEKTTEFCQKMNGKAWHKNDPIWKKIYPPNHFNCRSNVVAMTKAEVKGIEFPEIEGQETTKGQTMGKGKLPKGVDKKEIKEAGKLGPIVDHKEILDKK